MTSILATNSDFGNQEINNFCVTSPCSWTLNSSATEETCNGDDNGSITVSVTGSSGPFTYDIGNGPQNSGTFPNLAQGNYSVIVDDGTCSSLISVVLSGPSSVTGTVTTTDITCNGFSDGTMTVTGAGGNSTYLYDFGSGLGSSGTATGLGAGVQTVSIQDGNGCTGSASGTINQPIALNANSSVTDETFGMDGEINITVSGGVAPYSFSWTGPSGFTSTNEDITGLVSGLYSLTITDDNGCVITVTDILVDSFIGLAEEEEMVFNIYPNPANGIFNIIFNGKKVDKATVSVFDLTGRLVYLADVNDKSEFSVNISNKANGTYIIRVLLGEKQYQKRIVNIK